MAKSNIIVFKGVYVHLDATHPQFDEAMAALAADHVNMGYGSGLGVNTNDAGTEAVVKAEGLTAEAAATATWAKAVLGTYPPDRSQEVRAMVKQDAWRYKPTLRESGTPGTGLIDTRKS